MEASRELDKLVAEKVFGFEVVQHNQIGRPDWYYKSGGALILVPQYSKHIANAWLVVEKLKESYWVMLFCQQGALCTIGTEGGDRDGDYCADAGTAPHAICLAALKAVTIHDEDKLSDEEYLRLRNRLAL